MGGGSSTTQRTRSNTNQTQTNTPFAPALPGLTDLAGQIRNATNAVQALPAYSGDFIATGGALQQAVIPQLQGAADLAGQLVDPALQASGRALSELASFGGPSIGAGTQGFGSYDASAVQPVIEAAMQPYLRQLTEQILPGMQSSAIESGAYSNDRAFAVMPQTALRDTSRMAAEVGAGVAHQDFLAQQQRLQNAYQMSTQRGLGEADVLTQRLGMYPELLDTAMRMRTGQADLTAQAATYDTAMRQAEIQNDLMRDQYNAQVPFRGLDTAAQLYGAFAPYATQRMTGQSNSTTTTQQQTDPFSQILQAGLGIGGMFLGMPGGLGGLFGGSAAMNPLISVTGLSNNPASIFGG